MTDCDTHPGLQPTPDAVAGGPPTSPATPASPSTPALLARPVMDRGSALWRFHTALDDLVVLTAVPAAAAVPEPADVADVLAALAAGLRQLDPVLEQLAARLAELADSPNADTAADTAASTAQATVDGQLIDGQVVDGQVVDGVIRCRVCGCTEEAACPGGCWRVPAPLGVGAVCSACVDADTAGVLAAALTGLAGARCGLARTAAATAAAGGHARQLVLIDPAHQAGLAGPVAR